MKKYGLAIADVSKWHLAWDRYSLGAAMVQQMSFRCAQRHKAIVVEVHMYLHLCSACVTLLSAVWQVSCLAQTEGLNEVLGVIYDDYWRLVIVSGQFDMTSSCILHMFRRHMEDLSAKLGSDFDLEDYARAPVDSVLRRARARHEELFKHLRARPRTPPRTVGCVTCSAVMLHVCLTWLWCQGRRAA